MKFISIKVVLFLALYSGSIYSQEDSAPNRDLKIQIGYQNFRTFDQNTSPLLYGANNGYLGLAYKKEKNRFFWSTGLSLSAGSNQSVAHGKRSAIALNTPDFYGNTDTTTYDLNPALSFVQTELSYSLFKAVGETNLYVGGLVFDRFSYAGMGADTWFFNQLSLQPAIHFNQKVGEKHTMTYQLATTALSYNVRQPYTLDPSLPNPSYLKQYLKTGSSIAAFNNFQQIELTIAYNYALSKGRKMGLTYQFMWMSNDEILNRNLGAYSNAISLTYTL